MRIAQNNDKVQVHYTGRLTDGTVFDSSVERESLEIHIGKGELIVGFEKALLGMCAGDKKTVQISPQEGYGEHIKDLVKTVRRQFLPKDLVPEKGMQLQLGQGDQSAIVTITDVTDDHVVLDANHPLAGKPLEFDIHLVQFL